MQSQTAKRSGAIATAKRKHPANLWEAISGARHARRSSAIGIPPLTKVLQRLCTRELAKELKDPGATSSTRSTTWDMPVVSPASLFVRSWTTMTRDIRNFTELAATRI